MLIKRFQEPLSTPLGAGKTALLNEATGEYLTFDETATAIWDKTEAPITFDNLVLQLLEEYEVDRNLLEGEVRQALETLSQKKLIELHQ